VNVCPPRDSKSGPPCGDHVPEVAMQTIQPRLIGHGRDGRAQMLISSDIVCPVMPGSGASPRGVNIGHDNSISR